MMLKKDEGERRVKKIGIIILVIMISLGILSPGVITMNQRGWSIETIDSTEDVGYDTSLALDTNGYPHISYRDWTNGDVKYAYQDASGWHISIIDSIGYVGYHTSLALDSNDYPHISYHDETNGDLKYVYQDADGWHISIIDSTNYVGAFTSLALDNNDYSHISYHDMTNGDLKYVYQDASGWHISIVDSTEDVGWYTSISLDSNDSPHISYHDMTNNDLKYAYQDASGWHISIIDSIGYVGEYTSLALDSNDYPHISYFKRDDCKGDLKYAYQDSSGWHNMTVDGNNYSDIGYCSSLALDSNDYPHISYLDWKNHHDGDLKYAYQDSSGWHTSIVDSSWDVGFHTSIALKNHSYPHISYYDFANGNLKYAKILPSVDYILITDQSKNELPNSFLATQSKIECYASSFNTTYGDIDFIDVTWNIQNSGGSNASINTTSGSKVELYTGWYNGTVTLSIDDGNGHTDTIIFTINSTQFSMTLYQGWNLITIPVENTWTAETLGQHVTDCTIVTMFNSSTHTFVSHTVGTPHDDFPIMDGRGYFVYCITDNIFKMHNLSITIANVTIYVNWNMIGWYHEYPATAESLGENISGTSVVTMFDGEVQSFRTHIVDVPHDNFTITRGMALFIYTSQESYWHGEG